MKKCALYVCFRSDAKHPLITDEAHQAGLKLDILTHASFVVKGGPVFKKDFAELVTRNVKYGVIKEKGEDNTWQKPQELSPKDEADVTLSNTIDMLVAKWVERLQCPPDAFEVWLAPLTNAPGKHKASRVRYQRKPGGFTQTQTEADLPASINQLRARFTSAA